MLLILQSLVMLLKPIPDGSVSIVTFFVNLSVYVQTFSIKKNLKRKAKPRKTLGLEKHILVWNVDKVTVAVELKTFN